MQMVWHRIAAVLEEKGVHSSGDAIERTAV
jgi:hypothetical protein